MKRNIISIDEQKCTGCGQCVPECPEGALQIIDGKARLVSDLFCDGLGACIGNCPEAAIRVEEREAEPYDEYRVMANIVKAGPNLIRAHLKHLSDHGEKELYRQAIDYLSEHQIPAPEDKPQGACKNCSTVILDRDLREEDDSIPAGAIPTELRQWPTQLRLINPAAAFFDDADLLLSADCAPLAYGDFHRRFLKGKIVINFCPKLDPQIDQYIYKLAEIFKTHAIRSVTVVRMQVPCCGGMEIILKQALELAGKTSMVRVYVISSKGEIL